MMNNNTFNPLTYLESQIGASTRSILQHDLKTSRHAIDSVSKAVKAMETIQDLRENADFIALIYGEYPEIQALNMTFFYVGNLGEAMDFRINGITLSEPSEQGRADEIIEEISLKAGEVSVDEGGPVLGGKLCSDTEILRFFSALRAEQDEYTDEAHLHTTREQIAQTTGAGGDQSDLAKILFPGAWQASMRTLGLNLEEEEQLTGTPRPRAKF